MGKLKLRVILSVLCLFCVILSGCANTSVSDDPNYPYTGCLNAVRDAVEYIELPDGAVVDANFVEFESASADTAVESGRLIKIYGENVSIEPEAVVYIGRRTVEQDEGKNRDNFYLTFLCELNGRIIEYYGTALNGDEALNDPYVLIKNRCYDLLSEVRHGDDYHHTLFKLSISTDIIKPTTKHDIENGGYTVLNDTPADVLITIGRDAPTGGTVYNSYYELLCSTQSNEVTAWRRLDRESESDSLW